MKRTNLTIAIPLIFFAFVMFIMVQTAASAQSREGEKYQVKPDQLSTGIPTNQVIIKFNDVVGAQAALTPSQADVVARLSDAAGMSLVFRREMSGGAFVYQLPGRLSAENASAVAGKIMALPEVEYAEPDLIMQPFLTPNDPQYANQWHYFAPAAGHYGINMPAAWDIITGTSSVVVAVVDTGITDHSDLVGRTVAGYDFISTDEVANDSTPGRDNDPHDPGDWITSAESASGFFAGCPVSDSSWHGSHTAGTIGAASNNNIGVAGVNWVSKILPVRVLGKCGGYTSDIMDGVRWAAGLSVPGVPANANPAKVISLSLGGSGTCPAVSQSAINDVIAAGATMVVAAGNSNADVSGFNPANCSGVISVAATNRDGSRAYYSNYGALVKISAPGGAQSFANDPNGVLSTLNTGLTVPITGTYTYYQGTSMATPHVSGVASLLYSLNASITPAQVLEVLQNTVTAFPGGSTCNTSVCGTGILNAGSAVRPRLSNLVPSSTGTGTGPINLTVKGFNFNHNSIVKWRGSPRTTTYISSMELRAAITAGDLSASGSYTVTVDTTFSSIGVYTTAPLTFKVGSISIYLPQLIKPPTPGVINNGSFESGSVNWTEFSSGGFPLIINSGFPGTVLPHGGVYAVWLGGGLPETSYIQQPVVIDPAKPYLAYWHWIASQETTCGNDFGGVMVNGVWADKYNLCTSANTSGWVKHVTDLSAYSGQLITLQIRAETDATLNSNLFIDDVSFQSTPTVMQAGGLPGNANDEIYQTKREALRPR